MDEHSHLALVAVWVKREWYWLTTAAVVITYSIRWVWLKYMGTDYMERVEVIKRITDVEERLSHSLTDHEKREFARQDKFDLENKDSHKELGHKIDKLTDIIIENMRK